MPIRFRCRHCSQLMGIARRKAGTMVSCPTCRAQVLVPQEDEEVHPPPLGGAAAPPIFERSDFEAFLENPPAEPTPAPPAHTSPFEAVPSAPSLPPSSPSVRVPPSAGLILSPTQATWLTVAVILLVALAFGAGLLVGYYWMG